MLTTLLATLNEIVSLTEQEIRFIQPLLVQKSFRRGTIISKENCFCDFLLFLHQGYLRIFINGDPKEITIHLAGPGEFITAYDSFITRTNSIENIQAITDAEVLLISYDDLQLCYNFSHNLERLGRLVIEQHFVKKERRVISFITEVAEKRYKNFSEKNPLFIQNIPLHYIASYLGISPETLSRIRAK